VGPQLHDRRAATRRHHRPVRHGDDLAKIEAWGYVQLTGSCYYLAASAKVDAEALRAGLASLQANPRFHDYLCPPAIAP
jgi:hypothetical protein